MSNPDKHKPLSPEELLKLLDDKSNKGSAFDDSELDDFEKEALEGFSSHAKNTNDAKRMMDEMNISISDEVSGRAEKNRKNKILWFSAAASLAVIVIISAVFFKQTDVGSNIALNEVREEKPVHTETTAKDLPPAKETPTNETLKLETQKQIAPQETVSTLPDNKATTVTTEQFNTRNAKGDVSAISQEPAMAAGEGAVYKGAAKNKLAEMDMDNHQVASNTATLSDKLTEKAMDEISLNENLAIATKEEESKKTNAAPSSADMRLAKEKADSEKKSKEKAAVTKAARTEDVATGGVVSANTSAPGYATSTNAYYNGGELAIKNYVINYLKEHQETTSLKGKYKVKAIINEQGELKVKSIMNSSNDCGECVAPLTKVLNTMKNWIPAKDNNNNISSETDFMLMF